MGGLLSCICAGSQPPYDKLSSIYAAAVELSGSTAFPAVECVAGQPPLARLGFIYAVFRELSGDGSLPSQECVEGEAPADRVSRIYQAARAYAADDTLVDVSCIRGTPIWQQFLEVYRALYVAAGSPAELTDPNCVSPQPSLQILDHIYCALLLVPCEIPFLESAIILGTTLTLSFSEEITGHTGFSIEIAGDAVNIAYVSGEGTNVLVFESDPPGANPGDEVLLDYNPGDVTNRNCPLGAIDDFVVTNNTGVDFTFLRPGGVDTYFRPDGTSIYIRP